MKTLRVFALLSLAPLAALAQNADPLKTWGPTFNFNGLYVSGPNSGSGIGVKKWLSPHDAVVAGVTASHGASTTDYPDSVGWDGENTHSNLFLNLAYQRHALVGAGFSPYLTGGVSAGFVRSEDRQESFAETNFTRTTSFALALIGGAGVEYWVTRRISLAAQQMLDVRFQAGKREDDDFPEAKERTTGFGLGVSSLMLTVYL